MEFIDVVRKRRSIRHFKAQPVEESNLCRIVEAANDAPSAGNLQAYEIHVVKDPSIRKQLDATVGNQGSLEEAPVVLVFCIDPKRSSVKYGRRGDELYCIQDATIACTYAQLAATDLGLASVWVGAIRKPEVIQEILHLKKELLPIALLPIGYAAETPEPKSRRALSDIIHNL